jgi:hypothetical protein
MRKPTRLTSSALASLNSYLRQTTFSPPAMPDIEIWTTFAHDLGQACLDLFGASEVKVTAEGAVDLKVGASSCSRAPFPISDVL